MPPKTKIVKVGPSYSPNVTYEGTIQRHRRDVMRIQKYDIEGESLDALTLKNILNNMLHGKIDANYDIQIEAKFDNIGWRNGNLTGQDEEVSIWSDLDYEVDIDAGNITQFRIYQILRI